MIRDVDRPETASVVGDELVLDVICPDGVRRIGGIAFTAKRTSRFPLPTLGGPPRDFVAGLRLALRHQSSPTHDEVAEEHGYTRSWVTDIIRNIEERELGTTIETVVMLRESIPYLDWQMTMAVIRWPRLCAFVDYRKRRSGRQTAERLETQAARRKAG